MTNQQQDSPPKRRVEVPVFGVVVTAFGVILLLNSLDVLEWGIWRNMWRLWPVLLVLLGLKMLTGKFHPVLMLVIAGAAIGGAIAFAFALSDSDLFASDFSSFTYEAGTESYESFELDISFGAGQLIIEPLDTADTRLLVAEFFDDESDVEISTDPSGTTQRIRLEVDSSGFPFISRSGDDREWTLRINPDIPVDIRVSGGAGEFILDLEDTQAKEFELNIGAADLDVRVPANAGYVQGSINTGAADVEVTVPQDLAARIDNDSGVSAVEINSNRFPKTGDVHQSPDYETAANRLDLSINAGASNIVVR